MLNLHNRQLHLTQIANKTFKIFGPPGTGKTTRLIKLIENPDIRKQYGQAGLQKAKKEFDERDVCKIVLNTYNQCISLAKAGSKI